MFGMTFGLQFMAIAVAASLVVGSAGGWKVRDAFCDAAEARAEVEKAKAELKTAHADLDAAKLGEKTATAQAESIEEQKRQREEQIRELTEAQAKKPAGDRCALSDDVARRLRPLGRTRAGGAQKRPAGGT